MISLFDDLSDLSLIELFSYLSCADALWSFSRLNSRLTILLRERGFYHHVNLSSTRRNQFEIILSILRLDEIQSLVIDRCASPRQLRSWPYLPNLTTLRLQGVRDHIDVFEFAKRHGNTLSHLTVESSGYFRTVGRTEQGPYPLWDLRQFLQNIVRHLSILQSLDFGMETSFYLHDWPFKTIQTPLIHLKISLGSVLDIINIMSTKPLSHTLQELHVRVPDFCGYISLPLCIESFLPRMESLHTFTFAKSFKWHSREEWTFVNLLTTSNVMPVLRRMNFSIVIDVNDLDQMTHSALFVDDRHIDVHYAFIINDNRPHSELNQYVPRGSMSHPRQIASATFVSEYWPVDETFQNHNESYFKKPSYRQHLFYTLPWFFDEFFPFCVPDKYITELQTFTSTSLVNTVGPSHLLKLNMADNIPSSTTSFAHVMSSNRIVELHLYRCDGQISVNLPSFDHLILTDSLDSLNRCSFSRNIRSIQITLNYERLGFSRNDWTDLRTLSTLPFLNSLRILLYGMHMPPNETSCQIIAETASMVSDFCFCFRRKNYHSYKFDSVYTHQSLFIQQLRNNILALSLNKQSYTIDETDDYGLTVWF